MSSSDDKMNELIENLKPGHGHENGRKVRDFIISFIKTENLEGLKMLHEKLKQARPVPVGYQAFDQAFAWLDDIYRTCGEFANKEIIDYLNENSMFFRINFKNAGFGMFLRALFRDKVESIDILVTNYPVLVDGILEDEDKMKAKAFTPESEHFETLARTKLWEKIQERAQASATDSPEEGAEPRDRRRSRP